METDLFDLITDDNIFLYDFRKYKFLSYFAGPSITMECIEDGSRVSFDITAPIKDEFILCDVPLTPKVS